MGRPEGSSRVAREHRGSHTHKAVGARVHAWIYPRASRCSRHHSAGAIAAELRRWARFLAESARSAGFRPAQGQGQGLSGHHFRSAHRRPSAPPEAHTARPGPPKIHNTVGLLGVGHCRLRHSLLLGRKKSHGHAARLPCGTSAGCPCRAPPPSPLPASHSFTSR